VPAPAPQAGEPEGDGTDNRTLAERLSREAATADGHLRRAYRRAARAAFLWPEEARDLLARGESLQGLRAIGPYLERRLLGWLRSTDGPLAPPPIRRGFLTWAEGRRLLAAAPAALSGPLGDLQVHTTWSDGSASVREMAEAARGLGRRWLAITDHSQGLPIAGGIDEEELREQEGEIVAADEALRGDGFRVLRSMEVNLSPTGEVDMDPAALARLDVVLGAFHSALRRTEDQTDRYLAGLRNPSIQVLAHPRGRIYGHRIGLRADWPRVFAEAARLDEAVEIDAYPDRQDLDGRLLPLARAAGCRISLGSDAHGFRDLEHLPLAAAAAAAAGIPPERVLNTMSAEDVTAWAASVRDRSA
jgi:histidinol phosphatase-like PHP family hydrolase